MPKALGIAVAAVLAFGALDRAWAFQGIMVEEGQRPNKAKKKRPDKPASTERPTSTETRPRPRGSSTYIPPPVPSPYGSPQPMVRPPPPSVYTPPPVNSFGDRATNCLHSFPLNAGVGNNPTDRDAYVRQCAN